MQKFYIKSVNGCRTTEVQLTYLDFNKCKVLYMEDDVETIEKLPVTGDNYKMKTSHIFELLKLFIHIVYKTEIMRNINVNFFKLVVDND